MSEPVLQLCYLAAGVLFIIGIKRMSSPVTARRGNWLGAMGMLIAIIAALLDRSILGFGTIWMGMLAGSAIGLVLARTVKMTAMPQMVGLLNGFGGGASVLVGSAEYARIFHTGAPAGVELMLSIQLSVLIGGVTFSGSMMAFGKLQELLPGRALTFPLQKTVNALLFAGTLTLVVWLTTSPDHPGWLAALIGLSLILGALSVLPIGGADMPVVISLLNSYSGLAAAMTGFVIANHGLIISGALVGASGIILTQIMCRGMNRSLANVLFGAFGSAPAAVEGRSAQGKQVRAITPEDAAMVLGYARTVIIVPGYGLAVAQAQHEARELAEFVEQRGGDVKYAIHPVAGRMPGHMNVLLAEANVPYDRLYEMELINPEFEHADVALVVGANDVVNPAARTDPQSPLYGMPILDVDKARNVIVLKRSMNPGFAGIENELFYDPKTSMLFGDAKDSMKKLVAEVKAI